jgi:1,4-dihydroxy-6-naphthoate synthase
MNDTQLEALDRLFQIGYENNFYEYPICAEDFMIPHEYMDSRG